MCVLRELLEATYIVCLVANSTAVFLHGIVGMATPTAVPTKPVGPMALALSPSSMGVTTTKSPFFTHTVFRNFLGIDTKYLEDKKGLRNDD